MLLSDEDGHEVELDCGHVREGDSDGLKGDGVNLHGIREGCDYLVL
jgi:hypothetical protein